MPEEAEEGDAHGVGRGPVDRVGERAITERPLPDPEWSHERLLVADCTLVRVGRHDSRVADPIERLLERQQPARLDPVIVGDQDLRTGGPIVEWPGRPQCPWSATRRAAGYGLAALLVEIPPLGPCPLPGHVRLVLALAIARLLVGGIPAAWSAGFVVAHVVTSGSIPGAGSRGTRTGRPSRSSTRFAARVATGDGSRLTLEEVEEERRDHGGDRNTEDRPGDPGHLRADQHRAQDDDRVDSDRILHEPRLEDVHHQQPADPHEDERRQGIVRREPEGPRSRAAPRRRTARRTGSP